MDRRGWAALLLAAAMLLRLLVPNGFMLDRADGVVALELCSGTGPMLMGGPAAAMPMHHHDGKAAKADMPCAFSGVAADALGGIDPILYVALVAFVMAVARAAVMRPALVRRTHLRPPLRGPPLRS